MKSWQLSKLAQQAGTELFWWYCTQAGSGAEYRVRFIHWKKRFLPKSREQKQFNPLVPRLSHKGALLDCHYPKKIVVGIFPTSSYFKVSSTCRLQGYQLICHTQSLQRHYDRTHHRGTRLPWTWDLHSSCRLTEYPRLFYGGRVRQLYRQSCNHETIRHSGKHRYSYR